MTYSTQPKSKTVEYLTWLSMKARCNTPTATGYKNYGGRGIKVCDRWNRSFDNFLVDMGRRPDGGYSIERLNHNDNYTPENCKWILMTEQGKNKSNNRLITYGGKTQIISLWARELGMSHQTLTNRLNLYRWPVSRAFETPVKLGGHYNFNREARYGSI